MLIKAVIRSLYEIGKTAGCVGEGPKSLPINLALISSFLGTLLLREELLDSPHELRSVVLELGRTHAVDCEEVFVTAGFLRGHGAQGLVGEDDVGRDALLVGNRLAQVA